MTGQFKSPPDAVAAAKRLPPMTNKDWEKRADAVRKRKGISIPTTKR